MTLLDDDLPWRLRYQPAMGAVASAALHVGVALAALPLVLPVEPRLTDRVFDVTIEMSSAPTEATTTAADLQAARNLTPGTATPGETAPQAGKPEAAASTPVPREPDLALIVPSATPPPNVTKGEIGSGAASASPPPDLEKMLPAASAPPLVSGRDFALAAPPAVPRAATVQPRAQAATPQQPIRQAVPNRASQQQPAEGREAVTGQGPSMRALDDRQRQARQDYLMQVIRKLSQYRFYEQSHESSTQGTVVARLTVGRDGRLLDVSLARSSGYPGRDRSVADTIRRAAPFAPLPPDVGAEPYTFVVPIGYALER